MKHKIAISAVFLVGWFFMFQVPHDVPGAVMSVLVGPFDSEQICEDQRSDMAEMFAAVGIPAQIAPKCRQIEAS